MIADVGALADWIAAGPGRMAASAPPASPTPLTPQCSPSPCATITSPRPLRSPTTSTRTRTCSAPAGSSIQPRVAPVLHAAVGPRRGPWHHLRHQHPDPAGLRRARPDRTSPRTGRRAGWSRAAHAARAQHYDNANLIDFALAAALSRRHRRPAELAGGRRRRSPRRYPGRRRPHPDPGRMAGRRDGQRRLLAVHRACPNPQDDWIGPWSHGQGYLADPFQPSRPLSRGRARSSSPTRCTPSSTST